ncbi:MAG: DUF4910 domain-containing protein [Candidatus Eremiobacteraeota bacterium]|nr:DUF4910 domain-containing protein [Candidatus Eremiobacteraeota bacterium]
MKLLVDALAAAFPLDDSMAYLDRLTTWDRFQASDGIVQAAEFVAGVLDGYGLSGVTVHRFPCPSRWWTFDGPVSWTPRRAVLRAGGEVVIEYPRDAMSVATHAAAAAYESLPLRRFGRGDPAGAVLLVDGTELDRAVAAAQHEGALGIVTDTLGGRLPGARGRFELPIATKLFGFSLTGAEFSRMHDAASVDVVVEVDRSAPMPLVEASLPGDDAGGEILVQAHLCHPRPGANDNGSGVAAALGLAAALASLPRSSRRTIRFLFGPEFVGTVAYLHDFVETGRRPRPVAAINLDMVGENQSACGGPLTVELPPDHLPSPLGPIAAHVLTLLSDGARTYSGALPARTWSAITTPFVGASDQGVHADRSVGIPAIMIGHWPDRFNHTSFDTRDKVDPAEMRRAAVIAGTCAQMMASVDATMHEELALVVVRHTLERLLAAAGSPHADAGLLEHVAASGARQVGSLEGLTGCRSDRARSTIDEQRRLLCTLYGFAPVPHAERHDRTIERTWPGPFNVRGLLQTATGPAVQRIRERLATQRQRTYATVLALGLAIDGRSSRADVLRRARYGSLLDVDPGFANDVFDAMLSASWARER